MAKDLTDSQLNLILSSESTGAVSKASFDKEAVGLSDADKNALAHWLQWHKVPIISNQKKGQLECPSCRVIMVRKVTVFPEGGEGLECPTCQWDVDRDIWNPELGEVPSKVSEVEDLASLFEED